MKLKTNGKSKFLPLAAAALATLGLAGLAEAAPSVQLTVVYRGATTTHTSGSNTAFGATSPMDLTDPTVEATPGLIAVYDIYLSYNGGVANGNDNFQGIVFDINFGKGLTGASSNGTTNSPSLTTNKKYYSLGTNGELSTNQDGGTAGDLMAIGLVDQGVSANGYDGFGTTSDIGGNVYTPGLGVHVGDFGVAFSNGALTGSSSITITETAGASFSWYNDPNALTVTTQTGGFSVNTIAIIPHVITPEPASLGVLALGGLALLARRRKTA